MEIWVQPNKVTILKSHKNNNKYLNRHKRELTAITLKKSENKVLMAAVTRKFVTKAVTRNFLRHVESLVKFS